MSYARGGAKRRKLFDDGLDATSEVIAVRVGPEKKSFFVHKYLLTQSSDFFHKALEGNFREARERAIELSEQSVESFKIYASWLYTSQIHSMSSGSGSQKEPIVLDEEGDRLFSCMILGEFLQDKRFRNAVIDCIMESVREKWKVPMRWLKPIYEQLSPSSPLRTLILDFHICADPKTRTELAPDELPQDFWPDLALRTLSTLDYIRAYDRSAKNIVLDWMSNGRCKYHEHTEGERCE